MARPGRVQRWRRTAGAVQQPRYTPGGVADLRARRHGLAERVRRRSTRCGRSRSSRPGRPGGWVSGRTPWPPTTRAVAICRNELGFGRLTVVDLDRRRLDRCRSWHSRPRRVGRRVDRGAAFGRPHTHPDRAVRRPYVRPHRPRGRPGRRLGRTRPSRAGPRRDRTRRRHPARPPIRTRSRPPARVGPRRPDRSVAGRLPAPCRLLVEPRLGRARGRPTRIDRARPGVPAGVERRRGRLDVDDTAALVAAADAGAGPPRRRRWRSGVHREGSRSSALLADHGAIVAGGVASSPVSDLAGAHAGSLIGSRRTTPTPSSAPSTAAPTDIPSSRRSTVPIVSRSRCSCSMEPTTRSCPIDQSNELVERVRAAGGSVDYVVYEGRGPRLPRPRQPT